MTFGQNKEKKKKKILHVERGQGIFAVNIFAAANFAVQLIGHKAVLTWEIKILSWQSRH